MTRKRQIAPGLRMSPKQAARLLKALLGRRKRR